MGVRSIDLVTAPMDDLEEFSKRLWHTSIDDRPFFDAVVSGRHRSAFLYMRNKRTPLRLSRGKALELIARMGLLWCAHDVQLTVVRLRRAARKPLGSILLGRAKHLSVVRVSNIGRHHFKLMNKAFAGYCTEEELAQGKLPLKTLGKALQFARIERFAKARRLSAEGRFAKRMLDQLIVGLRLCMRKLDNLWWTEIRLDKPSGKYGRKKFSHIWWSDLDGLQPLAISVLRYLQTEALMADLVAEVYGAVDTRFSDMSIEASKRLGRTGPTLYGFLPGFRESDIGSRTRSRARAMVTGYRIAVVQDENLGSRRRARGESCQMLTQPKSDTYLDPAIEFLIPLGQRGIGDHFRSDDSRRRTLYALDVLPDVRLSR